MVADDAREGDNSGGCASPLKTASMAPWVELETRAGVVDHGTEG